MRRWWVLMVAATAGVVLGTRPFRVAVAGRSMQPSLGPGDYLVVTRAGRIRRGAVVVVDHPATDLEVVKRVAALPGDLVRGRPLPAGRYLVVGDNPAASTDGRSFGPVPREAILGIVRFRYWPRPAWIRRSP